MRPWGEILRLGPQERIDVIITATPRVVGELRNPRIPGGCRLAPTGSPRGPLNRWESPEHRCRDRVTVLPHDLAITISNDIDGLAIRHVPFDWRLGVEYTGIGRALVEGEAFLQDELPRTASYGTPVVEDVTGVEGSVECGIDTEDVLTCWMTRRDRVGRLPRMLRDASFDVVIPSTPGPLAGVLSNPRQGGICGPVNWGEDEDRTNNDCEDTVTVVDAEVPESVIDSARPLQRGSGG